MGRVGGRGGGGVLCIESYFPFDLRFNPSFDMFFLFVCRSRWLVLLFWFYVRNMGRVGGRGEVGCCVSRVISLLTCVYPSFDMFILCVHFICSCNVSRQTGSQSIFHVRSNHYTCMQNRKGEVYTYIVRTDMVSIRIVLEIKSF